MTISEVARKFFRGRKGLEKGGEQSRKHSKIENIYFKFQNYLINFSPKDRSLLRTPLVKILELSK